MLPDEVEAAVDTLRAAISTAAPSPGIRKRYVAFYLCILAAGTVIGSAGQEFGLLSATDGDFWRSAQTILTVLTGFMVTTMLFTGKAESAKSLTLEQLVEFSQKSNHLLVSQFATLLTHICGVVFIAAIGALSRANGGTLLATLLAPLAVGLLMLSLVRSILIPIQTIELHRFTQAALLAEKRAEIKRDLPD